ncbi:hypothetical protein [Desertibaculum subflavum]|uniref:hypothetical protein n=1 Tax=Desertibaculum subflavum TaxID=2268458 RepID=UPI000E65FE99
MTVDYAEDALAALDRVLQERPKAGALPFGEAVRRVAVYRDALIAKAREGGETAGRHMLLRANAVLSAVVAGNFPIGEVDWNSLKAAREELAEMVGTLRRERS